MDKQTSGSYLIVMSLVTLVFCSMDVSAAEQPALDTDPVPEQERERLRLQAEINYAAALADYGEVLDELVPLWPLLESSIKNKRLADALRREYEARQEAAIPPVMEAALETLAAVEATPAAPPFMFTPEHIRILSCGSTVSSPFAMIKTSNDPATTVYLGNLYREAGQVWTLESVVAVDDDTIQGVFIEQGGHRLEVTDTVGEYGTRNCRRAR